MVVWLLKAASAVEVARGLNDMRKGRIPKNAGGVIKVVSPLLLGGAAGKAGAAGRIGKAVLVGKALKGMKKSGGR